MTVPPSPIDWTPLAITVAPNGARRLKADHPAIPLTATELARTAAACREAGAAMIHAHVRRPDGRHLLDADAYREATNAIRRETGGRMIVQITTEAAGLYQPTEQMAVVRAVRPEAVSLAIREIVPDAAHEAEAARFFADLRAGHCLVQVILYDPEDVARYLDLKSRGIIPDGRDVLLFVLGRYTVGQVSAPQDLLPFLSATAEPLPWTVCAFGRRENACALAAAALGGHVRVGFENNLHLADGTLAPDNAALVAQIAAGARLLGRPLAGVDDIRALHAA
ncbi:3-keto-5-aminohexanoate cleavage protein [Oleisolibacter albus]|uniref:3-keto-5-aminohexanoate cleavage protein n=1 Tax=Oleisolibacter albus TaxID=2171757 RepID=UPI000DF4BCE4|nr:3-keto-5-aminohexanoate cleavage protein [Oleisolibacter albus]